MCAEGAPREVRAPEWTCNRIHLMTVGPSDAASEIAQNANRFRVGHAIDFDLQTLWSKLAQDDRSAE